MPPIRGARKATQACDNCRIRKTRCDRSSPCSVCLGLSVSCSYDHVLEKQGRKTGSGPLISWLKQTRRYQPKHSQSLQDQDFFAVVVPKSPTEREDLEETAVSSAMFGAQLSPDTARSSGFQASVDFETSHEMRPNSGRLSSTLLLAHIYVFLNHLFPIMPIVNAEELLFDGEHPETLSAPRYAFITSLCAATHIQLKLDGADSMKGNHRTAAPATVTQFTEEFMLASALNARKQYDLVEVSGIDTLLSSFFLFAAYGNLDKQKQAWFYLSQCLSQAISLGLHNEATYLELDPTDAEMRRRIFWVLFVTERTYALQQEKPVILRSSIQKPQVCGSECPTVIYGFLNHISLFEMLPNDLYSWVFSNIRCYTKDATLPSSIHYNLCDAKPSDSVVESQQLDSMITREWLKVTMWKLSLGQCPNSSLEIVSLLPFSLPFYAGKSAMEALASVDERSKDACGISMEQKLFDIGVGILDTAHAAPGLSLPQLCDSLAIGPTDLLCGLLKTLANIRGSQSHLFSTLLQRSDRVLRLTSPRLSVGWLESIRSCNPSRIIDHGPPRIQDAGGDNHP